MSRAVTKDGTDPLYRGTLLRHNAEAFQLVSRLQIRALYVFRDGDGMSVVFTHHQDGYPEFWRHRNACRRPPLFHQHVEAQTAGFTGSNPVQPISHEIHDKILQQPSALDTGCTSFNICLRAGRYTCIEIRRSQFFEHDIFQLSLSQCRFDKLSSISLHEFFCTWFGRGLGHG